MTTPIIAQKAPYSHEVAAGRTYYWCACGRSANQPFCDGSHKAVGMTPVAYKAEKDGAINQDEQKRLQAEVQKLTDEAVRRVDEALKTKEQEIMQV